MMRMEGLTCGYGSKVVIDNIDLEVKKGEFLGIIGPNGSGKTTMLRTITRLVRPMKGKIFLDNREIDTFSNNEIARRIAVVSQSLPVVDMTAKEFVLLGRIPYRKGLQFFEDDHDLSVAQEAMLMTDMKRLEDDYLSGMSGGEVQLAFIARAIAQEPSLLLLDEPTSHLDITHQVSILDLIRRLNRRQDLTVVITLHDLNLASEYCDRLALMDNGKIRHLGTPEEVLTYHNIEEAYDTVVVVEKNPLSGKPFVLVASEEIREKCKR